MLFKISKNSNIPQKMWIVVLLCICFFSFIYCFSEAIASTKKQRIMEFKQRQLTIEKKRRQTRKKIEQLKRQEYKALNILRCNQDKLEKAKLSLRDQQFRLSSAKDQLDQLGFSLEKLSVDEEDLKEKTGHRIREIYKGEHLSLLHMIVGAKDISTFLDRLYYQQKIIQRDKQLLQKLKQKTVQLSQIKNRLQTKKQGILSTINEIEAKKKEIDITVKINKDLINRLKTDRATYEAAENQMAKESNALESTILSLSQSSSKVSYAKGGYLRPIRGGVTSGFGWRRHPIFGGNRFHNGLDISAPYRSPIVAANNGKVIFAGWYGGYGKVVILDHGKSRTTLYAHMSSTRACVGQVVSKGQVIGFVGSSGYSTGPHLHFEVRIKGKPVNPSGHI